MQIVFAGAAIAAGEGAQGSGEEYSGSASQNYSWAGFSEGKRLADSYW
jgi:hypothetical protein